VARLKKGTEARFGLDPRKLAVGFLGYGVSLALFVLALRDLGTARTGAYFSSAPFLGADAAIVFLREPLTVQLLIAGCLMGIGVWLHLTYPCSHRIGFIKISAWKPPQASMLSRIRKFGLQAAS